MKTSPADDQRLFQRLYPFRINVLTFSALRGDDRLVIGGGR
jgi:hypothetical protein